MESIRTHHGFTLIELLVVFAIITVISGVVLANHASFNKTLILSNTAYDIALAMRSAETFGLGSRGDVSPNAGYGLHFQNGASFTLFADFSPGPSSFNCHGLPAGGAGSPDAKPGDCVYESGSGEKVTEYALGNGMTVNKLCAYAYPNWSCGLSSLDIVFARPNPDPFIRANGDTAVHYTDACITVTSPQGGERHVSVAMSGRITANASSCP